MPDIVTAERGAPNLLYPGDANLLGDYLTVTADRPILPIPIALRDAPTWYESAYEGTDVATGANIGGSERLTWGQYKGEVDDSSTVCARTNSRSSASLVPLIFVCAWTTHG